MEDKKVQGAAGLNAEIGREMDRQISFRQTSFSNLFLSLDKGLTDVAISGISVTEERQQQVGFSDSYHESLLALLVPSDSPARTLDDLKGRTIGVKSGSTGDAYLKRFPGHTVRRLDVAPDVAAMFAAGQLGAVVYDRPMIDLCQARGLVNGRPG